MYYGKEHDLSTYYGKYGKLFFVEILSNFV